MSNGLEYHVADTGYLALAGEMKEGKIKKRNKVGKKDAEFILDKAIK